MGARWVNIMQNIGFEWRDEVPVVKPHWCLVDMVAPRGDVRAGVERGDMVYTCREPAREWPKEEGM